MPKVTITFNLPEEKAEYTIAHKAGDLACAMHDVANMFRQKLKYEDGGKEAEELSDKFWEIMKEYELDPYCL